MGGVRQSDGTDPEAGRRGCREGEELGEVPEEEQVDVTVIMFASAPEREKVGGSVWVVVVAPAEEVVVHAQAARMGETGARE